MRHQIKRAFIFFGLAVGLVDTSLLLLSYLTAYFFSSARYEFIVYDNLVGEFWVEVAELGAGLVGLLLALRDFMKKRDDPEAAPRI